MPANRVKTTTTSTGTGNITVSATPAARCRPLSDIPVNAIQVMLIEDEAGTAWEMSECTILSATTFSRDTVLIGSNGTNKVSFGAGTKTVSATLASDEIATIKTGISAAASAAASAASAASAAQTTANQALAAGGGGGSGVRTIAFNPSIPLDFAGTTLFPPQTVTGPVTLTVDADPAPVAGSRAFWRWTANGNVSHIPNMSAIPEVESSAGWVNTAGTVNLVEVFHDNVGPLRSINQIAAAPGVPTVSSVTVSPSTAAVAGGGTQTYTAAVSGTNSPAQTVTWAASAGTITSGGVFTAPAATGAAQTITITATSTVDNTKSGTATATIASNTSTVTGVTVTPSTANVAGGATQQFTAAVAGTNSPSQAVSWGTNLGTISTSGLYTAPAATGATQTATITATSTQDGTKSGTATATTAAVVAGPAERFSPQTGLTESATAPYSYNGVNAGTYLNQQGVLNKQRQPGVDCSFRFTVSNTSSNGVLVAIHNSGTPTAYTSIPRYMFGSGSSSYQMGSNGGAASNNYTAGSTNTTMAVGDIYQVRFVGTTAFFEVAKAATPNSFTVIGQWAAVPDDVVFFQIAMASDPTVSNLASSGLV